MVISRRFRAPWLAALALLAFAQGLHAVEHLQVFFQVAGSHHDHGACGSHSHDAQPSESGEAPTDHGRSCDHSHSPAILETQFFIGELAIAPRGLIAALALPEAPVREIEYPPQLS